MIICRFKRMSVLIEDRKKKFWDRYTLLCISGLVLTATILGHYPNLSTLARLSPPSNQSTLLKSQYTRLEFKRHLNNSMSLQFLGHWWIKNFCPSHPPIIAMASPLGHNSRAGMDGEADCRALKLILYMWNWYPLEYQVPLAGIYVDWSHLNTRPLKKNFMFCWHVYCSSLTLLKDWVLLLTRAFSILFFSPSPGDWVLVLSMLTRDMWLLWLVRIKNSIWLISS